MLFEKSTQRVVNDISQKLSRKIDEFTNSIRESHQNNADRMTSLEQKFATLQNRSREELELIRKELVNVLAARENVEKTMRSFADIQRKVERIVEERLESHISLTIEKLSLDAQNYQKLRERMEDATKCLIGLKEEVSKLKDITSKIKAKDFELSAHAKELRDNDAEKLRLLKKIDDLERLVARMRRNNR